MKKIILPFGLLLTSICSLAKGQDFNITNYTVGQGSFAIVSADLDNNHGPDLAVSNTTSGTVSVLLNNGTGQFATSSYGAGSQPRGLVSVDYNRDGHLDLLTAGSMPTSEIGILVGDGAGNFSNLPYNGYMAGPIYLYAADFTGFGFIDFATVSGTDGGRLAITFNNAGGIIPNQQHFTYLGVKASHLAPYSGPYLALTGTSGGVGYVVLAQIEVQSDVAATRYSATSVGANTTPTGLAVADLNQDYLPDVVTTNYGSGTISVLTGLTLWAGGDGLVLAGTYEVGTQPQSVAIGDLDGDGKADLAVANQGSSSVTLLFGNGQGAFSGRKDIALAEGAGTRGIVMADFNGDGKLDLAVCNAGNGTVSVLMNNLPTLAVSEAEANATQVYPNPTTGIVHLEVKEKGEASVYNLNGQLVQKQMLNSGKNDIDLSALSAGVYFIRFNNQNFKIIKE